MRFVASLCCAMLFALPAWSGAAEQKADTKGNTKADHPAAKGAKLDLSGKPRKGKASYYASKFHGRKMADGTLFHRHSNAAASKTLPLGTVAEVKNLENGKSEVVQIRDRGPYKGGRIIDVSPAVAEKLDMKEDGVAQVEVRPIDLPR